jgi:hypothetical protein
VSDVAPPPRGKEKGGRARTKGENGRDVAKKKDPLFFWGEKKGKEDTRLLFFSRKVLSFLNSSSFLFPSFVLSFFSFGLSFPPSSSRCPLRILVTCPSGSG